MIVRFIITVALLATGCVGGSSTGTGGGLYGDRCVDETDCLDTLVCVSNRCRTLCNSHGDCQPLQRCISGSCLPATTGCGDGVQDADEACDDGNVDDFDDCTNDCELAVCGDGLRRLDISATSSGAEDCDNGIDNSDTEPDACRTDCTAPRCGDGVVDTGEGCDDGNQIDDGNGCSATCTPNNICGNGTLEEAVEQCDEGAANSDVLPNACRTNCRDAGCGDGVTDNGEQCDDGNAVQTDSCKTDCRSAVCGDGIVRADIRDSEAAGYEECDEAAFASDTAPDACRTNCRFAFCGDGVIDTGEMCDDSNPSNADACLTTCRLAYCGDGFLRGGVAPVDSAFEECDAGLHASDTLPDSCRKSCHLPKCGDGAVDTGEACDDGNVTDDGNGCDEMCQRNDVCGDGVHQVLFEACDDGMGNSDVLADACRTDCKLARCGDGVMDAGEECDDGNSSRSDTCVSGPGAACTNAICGDGWVQSGMEDCDDGNTIDDGDGCSAGCLRVGTCGDGTLQPRFENCDNGVDNSNSMPDACRADCTQSRCGDSVTDTDEECDDGNSTRTDDCDYCRSAVCGDGIVRLDISDPMNPAFEECDDALSDTEPDACRSNCRNAHCGDGVIDTGEECDDGDAVDTGNGCSATCQRNDVCGNNTIESLFETCDDGNMTTTDDCPDGPSGTCQPSRCGDGHVHPTELCDDGNDNPNDACPTGPTGTCLPAVCGDGIVLAGVEDCDDGDTIASGNGCDGGCLRTSSCGDGVVDALFEECDDGTRNADAPDACRLDCTSPRCGDGILDATEECDDGNTESLDGCTGSCSRVLWTQPLGGAAVGSSLGGTGRLVTLTSDGTLTSLELETGLVDWTTPLGSPSSVPPSRRGSIYVVDDFGVVRRINPLDGGVAGFATFPTWSAGSRIAVNRGAVVGIEPSGTLRMMSVTVPQNGTFIAPTDPTIGGLGNPPYTYVDSQSSCTNCAPSLADVGYGLPAVKSAVGAVGDALVLWDITGDCPALTFALSPGENAIGAVVVFGNVDTSHQPNDVAYAATSLGRVLQIRYPGQCQPLELVSDATLGETPVGSPLAVMAPGAPAGSYGFLDWARWLVVGTAEGSVHLLGAETEGPLLPFTLWSHDLGAPLAGQPAVDSAYVAWVGDSNGFLHALDLVVQKELWSVALDGPLAGSPIVADNLVYATTVFNTVYAIETDDRAAPPRVLANGWARANANNLGTAVVGDCSSTGTPSLLVLLVLGFVLRGRRRTVS